MQTSLVIFNAGLQALEAYIQELSRRGLPRAVERVFEYNCVVISLYGYLERYIDDATHEYLRLLTRVVRDYRDLPPTILNDHTPRSASLLSKLERNQRLRSLTPEVVVANLNSCLNQVPGAAYALNSDAFSQHGNLRTEVVKSILEGVGVDYADQKLKASEPYRQARSRGAGAQKLDVAQLIDDLVERRNEVAHGAVSQTLSNEILADDYLPAVRAYVTAIDTVLEATLLRIEYSRARDLGTVIAVFNNEIICFELSDGTYTKGDFIIAQTGDDEICGSVVAGMEINRVAFSRIQLRRPQKVAFKIGFHAKRNQQFRIIPKAIRAR